jgi:hypothetical protein
MSLLLGLFIAPPRSGDIPVALSHVVPTTMKRERQECPSSLVLSSCAQGGATFLSPYCRRPHHDETRETGTSLLPGLFIVPPCFGPTPDECRSPIPIRALAFDGVGRFIVVP